MTGNIDRLLELIHPDAVVRQDAGRYGRCVVLREPKEPMSFVRVDGIPENTLVFSLDDHFDAPKRIFAGRKGECRRSDYVFVSETEKWKVVVCAELKKSEDEPGKIKDQLRGSTAFVGYCREILNQFWRHEFPIDAYEFHYVTFLNTTRKRGTRRNSGNVREVANTSVDTFLKLDGQGDFQFNRIIQKRN